jgi:hypothetical protein
MKIYIKTVSCLWVVELWLRTVVLIKILVIHARQDA